VEFWQSWWVVADLDRVWLEIAFEGGQALRVTVPLEMAEALDRGLAGDGDSVSFEAEDGRYTLALKKIVFVKRYAREATVGFGAAA
jgi:hypothetical protein